MHMSILIKVLPNQVYLPLTNYLWKIMTGDTLGLNLLAFVVETANFKNIFLENIS